METEDVSAPEEILPKSYRSNSPEEIRLLAIADNFQRQYSYLCPDRKPLLFCPVNECGVKKFVSTSLRPTSTIHCELFSWQGCASFVADSLSLDPLDPPVDLPKHLFSPTSVLQSQRATCFEYATLLCSLLLGENYDAYCVSGYAVKEMCLLDQSLQECPLLDTEVERVQEVTPEQKQQDSKYSAKLQLELKSRFVAQQKKKKQEAEAALLEKQKLQEKKDQQLADPLRGLRVHCWVLVLSGSRSIQENFFIDPLTGISYPTNSDNFLGIESVWNNLNYYVNMQDCSNGCADMMFDLDDLKMWEPVLFGTPSKKQLIQEVLKRKDAKLMGKKNKLVEEDEPKVFEMPRSWVSYMAISPTAMENRWPGGKKVIWYKQAQLERFAPCKSLHGLVTRLTRYKDRDCTEVTMVKEWYQDRSDFLLEKEVNNTDKVTTERLRHGDKYHLQLFRVKHLTVDTEVELHFSSARVDGLEQRVVSRTEMTELFRGRSDFLYYRHVSFKNHIHEFYKKPEEQFILKVVERFHRNSSKPANEDVAERVFLEPERLFEVTYHLTKDQSIPSKMSFIRPQESERGNAQEFSLDLISTFQVELSEKPFTATILHEMLLGLIETKEEVSHQIILSLKEVRKTLTYKEQDDGMKVWSRAQAELEHLCHQEKSEIGDILPPQEHLSEEETDSQDEQNKDWDLDYKSRNEEKTKFLRERCMKEEMELQRKQEWFHMKQHELSEQEKKEHLQHCTDTRIQIRAARERLHMHIQRSEEK